MRCPVPGIIKGDSASGDSEIRSFRKISFLSLLAAVALCGCSASVDGTLSVQLAYPSDNASVSRAVPAVPGRLSSTTPSSAPYPDYARVPSNRILIRVLAPHFAPIEAWFGRSEGRGVIGGIPPGARISVEVDEYDNTASILGTNAPLLGRGWSRGIALSPGEAKTVPVTMHAKGTIVTVCGAPPSGGAGTSGDSGAGGLDNEALLGYPSAVAAGPDDSIYVSSSGYGKVKRIDRYGYVADFAGDGTHGAIVAGVPASSSPIGAVSDIDVDPSGNLYLFNYWNQIVKVAGGVVSAVVYDNGIENPAARLGMAVVSDGLVYFLNSLDRRIYQLFDALKFDFVTDNAPHETAEPIDRFHYPINGPSGIAYAAIGESLVFADTENDRIMRVSLIDGNIYYLVADAGGAPFSEGVDPLAMAPVRPRAVDCNPITGNIYFVESGTNTSRVLYIDAQGRVRVFAGTGVLGFSGDGGPAAAARLYDPRGVAVDSRGNAYIADYGNHAVRMVVGGALP